MITHTFIYRTSIVILLVAAVLLLGTNPALAARRTSTPVGNDISWPQCGKDLPTNHAFGIVGVNGGLANNTNPCLAEQLNWASRAIGGANQPKVQLYVNTANPGEVIDQIQTWPTSSSPDNPYPDQCDGTNTLSCSWQYGWNRAVEAVNDRFAPAVATTSLGQSPAAYTWWLDVETMNTWQSGSAEALARNAATLEGMTAHYQSLGAKVGVYSTKYQWNQIVGSSVTSSSNLYGLDSWLAGARSLKGAQSNCQNTPLTPASKVTLTQYVSGSLDYDYSCV